MKKPKFADMFNDNKCLEKAIDRYADLAYDEYMNEEQRLDNQLVYNWLVELKNRRHMGRGWLD